MSGKPAARQGDMTQYGGPIVQGSAGVRIGAPTGVACSVCPGGMTSGNPVNPLLGAKVLPGETDLALPGPLPFILPHLQQLPDEDACTGGRFRPRLESAF
ncbi:hypothetical protein ECZU28_06450 [Escherichia coli]|nr:hypothetical protein ECZU28_06450 [Escherichia coli]